MRLSKTDRLNKIKDKITLSLNEDDLVFLKQYIHKHWYHSLYDFLGFDLVSYLKKL